MGFPDRRRKTLWTGRRSREAGAVTVLLLTAHSLLIRNVTWFLTQRISIKFDQNGIKSRFLCLCRETWPSRDN